MGIFSFFKKRSIAQGEKIGSHVSQSTGQLVLSNVFSNKSEQIVTPRTAIFDATFFRCQSLIAQTIGYLPLAVLKEVGEEKVEAVNNSTSFLLKKLPNDYMTSLEFRELLTRHAFDYGNGYAQIVKNGRGEVVRFVPLLPEKMQVKVNSEGRVFYDYLSTTGESRKFRKDEIFHIKGYTRDGIVGIPISHIAKESLGLSMATDAQQAEYFKNGAMPGIWGSVPGTIQDGQRDNLKKSIKQQMLDGSTKDVVIADQGLELKTLSNTQRDSESNETRVQNSLEICKWFGVPPELLGIDTGSDKTVEQLMKQFVLTAILPWVKNWEQAAYRDIYSQSPRTRDFSLNFKIQGLLEGDAKARADLYKALFATAGIKPNEIRKLEGFPSLGEEGEKAFVPLNIVSIENAGEAQKQQPAPDAGGLGEDQRFVPLIDDAIKRSLVKEGKSLSSALSKKGDVIQLVGDILKKQRCIVLENLKPVISAMNKNENEVNSVIDSYFQETKDYILSSKKSQILDELKDWSSRHIAIREKIMQN